MSCACGHHHAHAPRVALDGVEIPLARPLVSLQGRLVCADAAQMMLALGLLPGHATATRAEPGNLRFDLSQSDDPLVWSLDEIFTGDDAFAAHQARTAASDWGRQSGQIRREFQREHILPRIRPEAPQDLGGIHELLTHTFGSPDQAELVQALRDGGDLALSLVAEARGKIIGHAALSPIMAERPALALAPLAVLPQMQGRGIGSALVRAALSAFDDHIVTVAGNPGWYGRFGFRPVDWTAPHAGPCMQAIGPDLPRHLALRHAPAFAR